MAYALWCDMFSIKVPFIDNQHKKLLNIANDFHKARNENRGKESLFEILNSLIRYAEQHFRDEERLMEAAGYPPDDIKEHKRIHEQLINDIFRLHQDFSQSAEKTVYEMEMFLNSWLIQHILITDKKLELYCRDIQYFE